jgi:hypothetical protein
MMSLAAFSVGTHLRVVSLDVIVESPNWTEDAKARIRAFKQQAQPTDVIYHYCSEQSEWEKGMGSEGWIIVRNGEIVDSLVRRMN